jgi:hypothetical protein
MVDLHQRRMSPKPEGKRQLCIHSQSACMQGQLNMRAVQTQRQAPMSLQPNTAKHESSSISNTGASESESKNRTILERFGPKTSDNELASKNCSRVESHMNSETSTNDPAEPCRTLRACGRSRTLTTGLSSYRSSLPELLVAWMMRCS